MRFQSAGSGLAALLIVVSSSNSFATETETVPSAAQPAPQRATAVEAGAKAAPRPDTEAGADRTTALQKPPLDVKPKATEAASKTAVPAAAKPAAPAAAPAKPVRASPTLVATIDLATQLMHVRSSGRALYSWRISSGRRGFETPRGSFRPGWMARKWYSRQYDMSPMPYSVFFNQGIATHGTTLVSRLGRPASHGCIRLAIANARRFYNLVRKHGLQRTRIIVKGRTRHSRYATRRSSPRRHPSWGGRRVIERRSLGVVGRRRYFNSARSYSRTLSHVPRRRIYRARTRRLIFPGDRY